MNRYSLLLLLLFIGISSCKENREETLAGITKNYNEINRKIKDYTYRHVDDITHKDGGGISGYYRDDEVKKIISEHYSDSSRTFTEYYFDDGMLIFVFEQKYIYNKPISYTEEKAKASGDSVWYDDTKTRLETSAFYLRKNKLIKWLDAVNGEIQPGTADFIDKESLLWAETLVLLKQLKEQ
jgi:hypothetical protein